MVKVFRTSTLRCIRLDIANVGRRSVQYQPLPVIVQKEKPGVAFLVVLHPEFDEGSVLDGNFVDQVLDNSIFIPLRENFEANFSKVRIRWQAGNPPGHFLSQ